MVLWRPTITSRTNIQSRCFHYRGVQYKSRKSRDTWDNRKKWPWSIEWSRAKANRVLPKERTGHSKHPLPKKQEKTLHIDITRWSMQKSHWLYSLQPKMEKFYTVSKNKTGSWLWLRSWNPYAMLCLVTLVVSDSVRPHVQQPSPARLWAAALDSSTAQEAPLSTGFSRQALCQIQTLIEESRENHPDHSCMT